MAEVRSTEPGAVEVRTESGDVLDVRIVGGSADDLEVGTSYRFPLLYLEAQGDPVDPVDPAAADARVLEPVASFPDDCDCTAEYISDLDGDVIDPGLDVPFRRLALAFIAASFLATLLWAMARWYREVPL